MVQIQSLFQLVRFVEFLVEIGFAKKHAKRKINNYVSGTWWFMVVFIVIDHENDGNI